MKRIHYLTAFILAFALGLGGLIAFGRSAEIPVRITSENDPGRLNAVTDKEDSPIEILGLEADGDTVTVSVRPRHTGTDYIDIHSEGGEAIGFEVVYVHPLGVITWNDSIGFCRGSRAVSAAACAYIALILWDRIRKFRENLSRNNYQYRNIRDLGIIIFLAPALLNLIVSVFTIGSISAFTRRVLDSGSLFSYIILPLAFITFLYVSASNLVLMKREGRNWRNMLGFLLGAALCFMTILPGVVSDMLQRSTVIDVHYEGGTAMYVELFTTNAVFFIVSYLECMLIATIILAVKAARSVPDPDRDYMIVLGCRVAKDGKPTKLLQGRVDRALEFAGLQMKKTGKALRFVVSGGKGADEPVSEAEAMKNYLLSKGVAEESILTEDRSTDTRENMIFSSEIIKNDFGPGDPKIAFSTTNYHVFRSGIIASGLGILAQGVGSGTRSYFWINAFVREFIALIYSERRNHVRVAAALLLLVLALVMIVWYSVNGMRP